jgi:hypothetical protein
MTISTRTMSRTLSATQTRCRLTTADGTLLSTGQAVVDDQGGGDSLVIVALDTPGTVIERCLVGPVREVQVTLDDGPPHLARVERVFVHSRFGRACALRLLTPVPFGHAPACGAQPCQEACDDDSCARCRR